MKKIRFFLASVLCLIGFTGFTQISAPTATTYFPTDYTSGYISGGGTNDWVYVFCGNEEQHDVGELQVNAPGCEVTWYIFEENSFVELGLTGQVATGLTSGFYMATVDCGSTVNCYRAWVWVNQTLVQVHPIEPGCETFTLSASVDIMDSSFTIHDPPGFEFEIDENTFIQVCFWANHTYVSDLGFYLKAPGHEYTEPGNPGVVELLPSPSGWGQVTNLPWSVTGCAPGAEGVPCNNGNHVDEFCFSTNLFPGGPAFVPGNPDHVPCVCDMETPLSGIYAPAGPWDPIYGFNAADDGWAVQIYDCEYVDYGVLTYVRITFVGEGECGLASIVYESGDIHSPINDDSCDAQTASIYVVPPGEPAGEYTLTSQITNYSWSCTGSTFSGNQLSHQIVAGTADFPSQTSDFILTVTETINIPGNHSCNISHAQTFETLPVDATILPINPVCANSSPFLLQAVDGGGTWSTNAPAGSIQGNTFYPQIANAGNWTISYSIGGPCPDSDQTTITVYESISVVNFSDNVCDANDENFYVSFEVLNSLGQPTGFWADTGSGNNWYTGSFNQMYQSPSSYSITVTDDNDCNYIVLEGYRDCGCSTYAGTMATTTPILLCEDECTGNLTHNGNQLLDGNDAFQFILHDGNYPAQILAVNNYSPTFCFNQISNGVYGQTYYISAIAGNDLGNGNVDQNDPCYSQSPGTPVVWYKNPVAHISQSNFTTCGKSTTLNANVPEFGIGTWTANQDFIPLGGSTFNDPTINVLVYEFQPVVFTWTVSNNMCQSSANVTVTFAQKPTAYAGEDFTVCGNSAQLSAVLSLPTSSGEWSGPASFSPVSSPNATASVSQYGQYTFVWREYFADCYDQDYVKVTFLEEPNPTTIANFDTVCGVVYYLQAFNTKYPGSWSAKVNGLPFGANYDCVSCPQTYVIVPNYEGNHLDVEFTWTETNQSGGIECKGSTTVNVTFAKQPVASVGPVNFAEICGRCFTFNADTTGSGQFAGQWIGKDIIHEFEPPGNHIPNATVCVDSLGSFGDSAHVETQFLWVMNNTGCVSVDTMTLIFYRKPKANAGLDNAVCGKNYQLGAVYSFPETPNYDPYGAWTVAQRPVTEASATINPVVGDSVSVTVSHYGIWKFRFRENNAYLSSCFSADTVQIEFVEIPVVDAGVDQDVCGQTTQLNANSSGFPGSWLPNGASFVNYSDPNSQTSVSSYGPLSYIWLESNQAQTTSLSCSSQDTVVITYWRQPQAVILTDEADSTACGLTFPHLRAQTPASGVNGYWICPTDPDPVYQPSANNHIASVTVSNYGYHDFYWVGASGPQYLPDFCNDTAGPLRIHFIEIPKANAGGDTLFCGLTGNLNAIPSVGTGVWSTPSVELISFSNVNSPNATVTSQVHTGTTANPYFILIWTEDNTNECTDKDTIKVEFIRIPSSEINIVPPKCQGEIAILSADEINHPEYDWNFHGGVIDSVVTNQQGGNYEYFVIWPGTDTVHQVSLISTNEFGCQSVITIDNVFEPPIPDFGVTIYGDTCLLGKGAIVFLDTLGQNAFYWLNPDIGPPPGQPITGVYNLPVGEYDIRARYRTPNQQWSSLYNQVFGNDRCTDTVTYEIEPIGILHAEFEVPPDILMEELVAPEAEVMFVNKSDYGGVSRRCIWHFGDGNTLTSCDELVYHVYTKAGCFDPFLIIMNRDLQQCRDTARLDFCIEIDQESSLEIPNVFTPDGDGINDYFQVKARTLREFQGYIINRWGTVIYEWTNWQDEDAGWDGKLSGGSPASSGVYFYVIKAVGMDDVEYDERGHLHLLRD